MEHFLFLKPETVLFRKRCTEWEPASPLKLCNCWRTLAWLGTMKFMSKMEGRFICLEYQMWNSTGNQQYLQCFSHVSRCRPNRHKLIGNAEETFLSRYETQERLQKIENAGYMVISIWGCEYRKLLRDNPYLKNELFSRLSMPFTGLEPRP